MNGSEGLVGDVYLEKEFIDKTKLYCEGVNEVIREICITVFYKWIAFCKHYRMLFIVIMFLSCP